MFEFLDLLGMFIVMDIYYAEEEDQFLYLSRYMGECGICCIPESHHAIRHANYVFSGRTS